MAIAFLPGGSVSAINSYQPGPDLGGILNNLGGMGAAIANIIRLGRKPDINKDIPSMQSALNAAEAARVYADASVNPESPHFKNLAALEESSIRRDLITAINEIMKSNARAKASGRVGFGVNPERRDEARSGAIARAFAQAGEQSRRIASDKLAGASSRSAGAAGAFAPSFGPFAGYADMGRTYEASRTQQMGDLGQWIADILSGGPSKPAPRIPAEPRSQQPAPRMGGPSLANNPFEYYAQYPSISVTR